MEVCVSEGLAANLAYGRRMRSCENCQVGVGILSREEWVRKFILHEGLCPVCRKPAGIVPKEKPREEWMTLTATYLKYKISKNRVRQMVEKGEIRTMEGKRGKLIPESEVVVFGVRDG